MVAVEGYATASGGLYLPVVDRPVVARFRYQPAAARVTRDCRGRRHRDASDREAESTDKLHLDDEGRGGGAMS